MNIHTERKFKEERHVWSRYSIWEDVPYYYLLRVDKLLTKLYTIKGQAYCQKLIFAILSAGRNVEK